MQGGAMYAEIPQEAIQVVDPLIGIDKTYTISRFKVAAAKPTYKPFNAQLMIEFSEYTSIRTTQNPPNTFPAYVYKLTPFTRIIPADGLVSAYTGKFVCYNEMVRAL